MKRARSLHSNPCANPSSIQRSRILRPHLQDHWRRRVGRVCKHSRRGSLRHRHSARDAGTTCRCAAGQENRVSHWNDVGDIIVDGDDIFGDGVNVAARLEGISEPGGICISDVVYQQVDGRVEALFSDLGEKSLKNIARPVRVYRLDLGPRPTSAPKRRDQRRHRLTNLPSPSSPSPI